jgi:hypothetical protein
MVEINGSEGFLLTHTKKKNPNHTLLHTNSYIISSSIHRKPIIIKIIK